MFGGGGTMAECSWCHERYPSKYYFVTGADPAVCLRCVDALSPEKQEQVVANAAAATGELVRRCLRCQTLMMRGDLIYRDVGSGEGTQVREVKWAVARRSLRYLGLVSGWVVDKALSVDAWRCKACGYCELATAPDPGEAQALTSNGADEAEDATLL